MAIFYNPDKETTGEFAGRICQESWGNSEYVQVHSGGEHFRSLRGFTFKNLPFLTQEERIFCAKHGGMYLPKGYMITEAADGIGTKVVLGDAIQYYGSLARDLIAMAADDVARFGGKPLVHTNVVDYNSNATPEQDQAYRDLMQGLAEVAHEQDIVLLTGESAGLGACVGSPNPNPTFPFNWSGTMTGLQHEKLVIDASRVRAGDIIIALQQDGFRSNGISMVRRAFEKHYGPNYYTDAPREEIEEALAPSVVYARALAEINGWYSSGENRVDCTSAAHLSGGSFVSKFLEPVLLPQGLSAKIDTPYAVPEITRKCVRWLIEAGTPMPLETVYQTWPVGQGFLITVRGDGDAQRAIDTLETFGVHSQVAGTITETPKHMVPHLQISTTDEEGDPRDVFLRAK